MLLLMGVDFIEAFINGVEWYSTPSCLTGDRRAMNWRKTMTFSINHSGYGL